MINRTVNWRKRIPGCAGKILLVFGAPLLFLWLSLAQPAFRSSPPSEAKVAPADLERHVRMLAEEFSPRGAAHLGNLNRTAEYIKSEFQKAGRGEISEQWFAVDFRRFRNVSLLLGSPEGERIVIGAHYDGFGPHPAADDNASGVAGLIELAKLFAEDPPAAPVELVAYPLEEPPYFNTSEMGSWKHAYLLREAGVRVNYMVSLEMIGYFTSERGSQNYPIALLRLFYPGKGNFITVAGNSRNRGITKAFKIGMKGTTPLPVCSICGPASIPGIDFSDHRSYWKMGFPAIMVTDTAFYRNTAYHSSRDTADRLDYEKMAMVVVAVFEAVKSTRK